LSRLLAGYRVRFDDRKRPFHIPLFRTKLCQLPTPNVCRLPNAQLFRELEVGGWG
jgi:hypothetical protein